MKDVPAVHLDLYNKFRSFFSLQGSIGWLVTCGAYLAWILWIAYAADLWVYPFMRVMSASAKAMFFGFVFLFEAVLYRIGMTISTKYWGLVAEEGEEMTKERVKQVQ